SMKADFQHLPLAPATLHILLALAGEDLHGYGIMQEVQRQSEGRYRLGPGTLYDNLARLLRDGLVDESGGEGRRRYYRLTGSGRGDGGVGDRNTGRALASRKSVAKEGVMIRRFYIWLLRLPPPRFREEFAGEMLWIFDQARCDGLGRLVGDAAASLVRQWCFRSGMNGTQAV